jgi:hypothetical protein
MLIGSPSKKKARRGRICPRWLWWWVEGWLYTVALSITCKLAPLTRAFMVMSAGLLVTSKAI